MRAPIDRIFGWLLLLGIAGMAGCSTTDEGHSGQMASVKISGHPETEIEQAAAAVFQANGFIKKDKLVFEKEGTTWETMNYGGWSTDHVWDRMRLKITPDADGNLILGCDAYAVQGHGQIGMEDEHKYLFAKRSECKKILDQIKATLDELPRPAAPNNPSSP